MSNVRGKYNNHTNVKYLCFNVKLMFPVSYQSVSLQWRMGTSSLSSIFTTSRGIGMEIVSRTISLHLLCVTHQLQASLAEESLIVLSQLLPNATNITQRLDILVRAVREQVNSTLGVTETFIQV